MRKSEPRIKIFEDTQAIYTTNPSLKENIEDTRQKTKIIRETDALPAVPVFGDRPFEKTNVIVSTKRSFEAASSYAYAGKKTCVLNFADFKQPGGLVLTGAAAQEESLCRISTLYPCLNTQRNIDEFYAPHKKLKDGPYLPGGGRRGGLFNDDIIYTPGITVFKTDTDDPVLMEQREWYKVDVITCAAPDLRKLDTTDMDLHSIRLKRIRRIMSVAAFYENEALILGAFGCGVFANPPEEMADAMKDAIAEFDGCFETIEFPCKSKNKNYNNFMKTFCQGD